MSVEIRKTLTVVETIFRDGGRAAARPTRLVTALAVLRNPWAGRGFVEDLGPEIAATAPELGSLLTAMVVEAAGAAGAIEAYGKAAVVGLDGELEHASALIHTLRFGNAYRTALGATTYLAFTNLRGPAGCPIMTPMMDIRDEGRRSHYLTAHVSVPDAPAADEIVVALAGASGGRPHHRIGDRYQDLKELGHDVANPAAV